MAKKRTARSATITGGDSGSTGGRRTTLKIVQPARGKNGTLTGDATSRPARTSRRDVPHNREKYRWRDLVERLFNKLKNWRRVATGYDKTAESYLGFIALASVKLWIPFVYAA